MKFIRIYIVLFVVLFASCFKAEKIETVNAFSEALKLENGVLYYNKVLFSGNVVSYFDDLKLKSEVQYKHGRKHGYEKQWNNNGALTLVRNYIKGNKSGIHKAWWDNRKLMFKYCFNKNGEYHGAVKEWYETGQIYRDFNYKNGKEVGSQQLWKIDGTIKANYQVVNNERFGLIGLKKCYQVTVGSNEVK